MLLIHNYIYLYLFLLLLNQEHTWEISKKYSKSFISSNVDCKISALSADHDGALLKHTKFVIRIYWAWFDIFQIFVFCGVNAFCIIFNSSSTSSVFFLSSFE